MIFKVLFLKYNIIVKNYKIWGEKALFYFENHLSNERIWQVFLEEIDRFEEGL